MDQAFFSNFQFRITNFTCGKLSTNLKCVDLSIELDLRYAQHIRQQPVWGKTLFVFGFDSE